MTDLQFDGLPALPQIGPLLRLARKLWSDDSVVALWLGGSFAAGRADRQSDLDLRIAGAGEAIDRWEAPDFESLFDGDCAGFRTEPSRPQTHFHQCLLTGGTFFDLWIQTTSDSPPPDHVLVLGCRDAEFGRMLVSTEPESAYNPAPADPQIVCRLLVDFWMGSSKHVKVLSRSLEPLVQIGLSLERPVLLRLWHILATGKDEGANRPTIHAVTRILRAIEPVLGDRPMALSGLPTRSRDEILEVVQAHWDEVSRVGRLLADRMGFAYPARLESAVRTFWAEYLRSGI